MRMFKMLMLLLVMSIAIALTGCSSEDTPAAIVDDTPAIVDNEPADVEEDVEDTQEPDEVEDEVADEAEYDDIEDAAPAVPSGFVEYISSQYGFRVHYPDFWVLSDGVDQEDINAILIEGLGQEMFESMMDGLGEGAAVTWIDPTSIAGGVLANTTIAVAPSEGLTQADLQDSEVKELFAELYDEIFPMLFEGYSRASDISGATLGNNYFMFFEANASMFGVNMSFFQALTTIGPNLYTFTFTTPRGGVDVELFLSVLATFDS